MPADLNVTADPDRLRQVLDNLLGNALNHAPGSAVTLRAWTEGSGVTLQVQDAGPGISPQELPHLFERLYRADPSRQTGSGLGLSISRGIVQAHGGCVAARSAPQGSLIVEVWLPDVA